MRKILRKIVASMLCFMIILSNIPYIGQTFAVNEAEVEKISLSISEIVGKMSGDNYDVPPDPDGTLTLEVRGTIVNATEHTMQLNYMDIIITPPDGLIITKIQTKDTRFDMNSRCRVGYDVIKGNTYVIESNSTDNYDTKVFDDLNGKAIPSGETPIAFTLYIKTKYIGEKKPLNKIKCKLVARIQTKDISDEQTGCISIGNNDPKENYNLPKINYEAAELRENRYNSL